MIMHEGTRAGAARELAELRRQITEARKAISKLDVRGGGSRDHYLATSVRARALAILRELETGA